LGFLFNTAGMAEASDFKIGVDVGFDRAHHKITPSEQVRVAFDYRSSPKFGASL